MPAKQKSKKLDRLKFNLRAVAYDSTKPEYRIHVKIDPQGRRYSEYQMFTVPANKASDKDEAFAEFKSQFKRYANTHGWGKTCKLIKIENPK